MYLHYCNSDILFQHIANASQRTSSAVWRARDPERSLHRDHVYQRKKDVTGKLLPIYVVINVNYIMHLSLDLSLNLTYQIALSQFGSLSWRPTIIFRSGILLTDVHRHLKCGCTLLFLLFIVINYPGKRNPFIV